MKKILAIILSIAMLFGVLAINTFAADTEPKVTLITNEGSPVQPNDSTYLTVRFDNFSSIKGMDVTISADGATLGAITTSGTGFPTLKENTNYTITNNETKHEIRIVDLSSFNSGKITFEVIAPATSAQITVEGKYADSGKTLFNITTEPGTFEVYAEPEEVEVEFENGSATVTQETAGANKFIPHGAVYKYDSETDKYTYAQKDENGNFNITNDYTVNSFDIPANGITTFGASDFGKNTETVRFGSYSQNNDGTKTHGTMVFEGNWLALKNYYIKYGYSVQDLVNMIYQDFETTLNSEVNKGKTFVSYTLGNETINVYKFEQSRYIWKNNSGILEYGLQITNVKGGITYTAVAYSHDINDKSNAVVSAEVKSITKSAAN